MKYAWNRNHITQTENGHSDEENQKMNDSKDF